MKAIAKWIGITIGLLLLVVISLPFLINVDQFRPTLQSELSGALGREVTLGNLKLKILTGEVTADDLSVAEDPAFGKPAFLRAKSLHVGAEILPFLLSRKLIVNALVIDQPEISLVQSPSGDWNFSSLGGKTKAAPVKAPPSASEPLDLSVKLVKISNGRVSLSRTVGHWKPLALEQVNLELRDFSAASAFPFSLAAQVGGGGAIKLDGKAGPINPTDSAMTPVSLHLSVSQLDLARSGMSDVAPDIAGLVSFDGSGESDGVSMRLDAKLKGEKMKLSKNGTPAAAPLAVDFAVRHDLRKHAGTISKGDVHIGAAVAHLTGSYAERGDSMVVNFKLAGPNMPVQELEKLLPALGVVLPNGSSLQGGTASANFTMEGPADKLVTNGSVAFNKTRLVGFDLPKKMATIEKLAGIKPSPDTDIDELSATLRSGPDGTSAQNMKLIVPAIGELSGAGAITPANAVDFKMSAIVHTSGLLAVVDNTPIPFTVTGTCAEPVFRPDIKAVVKNKINSIVNGEVGKMVGGDVGKVVGGDVGKTATGLLDGFLNRKKK